MNKAFSILAIVTLIAAIVIKIAFVIHPNWYEQINVKKQRAFDDVTYFEKKYTINDKPVELKFYKIDTTKSPIGISTPNILEKTPLETKYSAYTLEEYAEKGDYKLVQSGGFLSSWSPPLPLGYVKAQDKVFNKVHESWLTTGIFCTNGREFEIDVYKSPAQFDKWKSCIQAGPIIALNKEIKLNVARNTWFVTGDRHRQSFLCKTDNGNLVMGIAENIVLTKFAELLVAPIKKDGIGCVDAVLLTSKGIAGIYSSNEKLPRIGNIDVPLPNVIVVK